MARIKKSGVWLKTIEYGYALKLGHKIKKPVEALETGPTMANSGKGLKARVPKRAVNSITKQGRRGPLVRTVAESVTTNPGTTPSTSATTTTSAGRPAPVGSHAHLSAELRPVSTMVSPMLGAGRRGFTPNGAVRVADPMDLALLAPRCDGGMALAPPQTANPDGAWFFAKKIMRQGRARCMNCVSL